MEREIIRSKNPALDDQYYKIKHSSGLTLLLCPMKGFSTAYALFGTNYGSIDATFKTNSDSDFVTVPAGIAHFLEHKLFENEDKDAFTRFAKTGASANAYTSFDKTCYLFSCSENFEQSLEILLDFVLSPYFTQETVQKEQGIIGQEIKMYEDDPQWRVMFNLLQALYTNNPVSIDIAGSIDSISKIDKDLLYRCYNAFYNLENMVLSIAGNFDVDTVLKIADKILKLTEPVVVERKAVSEEKAIAKNVVMQKLPVAIPLFNIGFKHTTIGKTENFLDRIVYEIILEIIAGETTSLYRKLYDEGLINSSFGIEPFVGRDYVSSIFAGESRQPEKVYDAIKAEIKKLKQNGIEDSLFERCKKGVYGRYILMFNSVEAIASSLLVTYFSDVKLYDIVETVANVTKKQVYDRLCQEYKEEWSAISIISSN